MRYTMREQPTLILTKSSSFIPVMLKSPQLLIFAPKVDLLPYLAFLTCFNDEVLHLKMSFYFKEGVNTMEKWVRCIYLI